MLRFQVLWQGNGKKYNIKTIEDKDLREILFYTASGKGNWKFLNKEKWINKIFSEAYKRKLCSFDILLLLHLWTLYYRGFTERSPRFIPNRDGTVTKIDK